MNDHPILRGGHALHSGKALELNFSPFELKLGLVSLNTLLSAMSTPPTCTAQNHHAELAETTEIEPPPHYMVWWKSALSRGYGRSPTIGTYRYPALPGYGLRVLLQ